MLTVFGRRPMRCGWAIMLALLVGGAPLPGTEGSTRALDVAMAGIPVDPALIVDQRLATATSMACTPASALTALRVGPPGWRAVYDAFPGTTTQEKLAAWIGRLARQPSTVDPRRMLFSAAQGVVADDFPALVNPLLAQQRLEPLVGAYLDRRADEAVDAHLARIHALLASSLRAGVPVLASIRVFAAHEKEMDWVWDGVTSHCVLITSMSDRLEDGQEGFLVRFAEPSCGVLREGYCYREQARGFTALAGPEGTWKPRGFLLVEAPSLILESDREPWYTRTFMTLNYALGRFAGDDVGAGR